MAPTTHTNISQISNPEIEHAGDDSSVQGKRKLDATNRTSLHDDEESPMETNTKKQKQTLFINTTNISSSRINDSDVSMGTITSSSSETTTIVEEFNRTSSSGSTIVNNDVKLRDDINNQQPAIAILSFHNYKKWNSEEVAFTLVLDDVVGGASLSVADVKPLCDADFKGTSLANIVQDINRHNVDSAIKSMTESNDFTQVSESTCKSVVHWVNNTLMPKLFGLWDKDQTKSALCKHKLIGGAGLCENQVQPLYEAGFNGTVLSRIVYELEKNERDGNALTDVEVVNNILAMEIDSSTRTVLVDWVKFELIAKNKIQVPLAKPSVSNVKYFACNKRYTIDHNEIVHSTRKKIQQFIQQFTTTSPKDISNIESIPNILLSSFGANFTFVDREESTKIIFNNFKQYSSRIDQQGENLNLDKTNITLPFIAAAPGVGKSKLLKEIGLNLYRKHFREQVTCYPLFVSFGNGTSITATEKDKQIDITQSFIIRVIFSFICHINGKKEDFPAIVRNWVATFENRIIDLNEVLDVITNLLGKDNIDFFIAIDEAHQIDNRTQNQHNPLRSLFIYLGHLLQIPPKPYNLLQNPQQPNYMRLFPLFAGTYHTVLLTSLICSTYTPLFVPVNALLSSLNIVTIIDNLSNTHPKLRNWRTNVEFRHYLRLFSGFPRGLEYYLEQYITQPEYTSRTAFETSAYNLSQKYFFCISNSIGHVLVSHILTRQNVLKNSNIISSVDLTFSDAENLGFIMLDLVQQGLPYFTCTYPPVLMHQMIDQQLRPHFEKLFFSTERTMYEFSWEDHVYDYLYLFFSLLSNTSDLSLSNLFPFALMSEKTAKLTLEQIPNCKQCTAKHQIQGTLNEKIDTTSGLLDITTVIDCTIIKNADSAQAGDILIIGLKLKDSPNDILVFHIQCKWADSEKSSETFKNISTEIEKNEKLCFDTKSKKTTNITVIMSGKPIPDLPNNIPDNVMIINKTNFAKYFGIFADSMKFFCSKQILHINEVNELELQCFPRIGEQMAKCVMKSRPSEGFKDHADMQNKIRTQVSNIEIATKLINILNETEIIF
ncbi:hypothetical protein C9374_012284 [Naegleria lovaniensis]|uniref:Uncharacterized protein n=1 Tax=Naegleria lovaniensis TaxID=51637 RepID=A0AA88KBT6_NAELO|nr:uncharacterized protein C9374_012284 [Naegleria lovaniensis]KAG2373295.1 hypothetical protein C9374_012284 [Naegleria lovaniensis]